MHRFLVDGLPIPSADDDVLIWYGVVGVCVSGLQMHWVVGAYTTMRGVHVVC